MQPWPDGLGCDMRAEIDSTNAEALRQAAAGRCNPGWIFARHQTRARGRRGRPWATIDGNFSASLLLFPRETPASAALRSFVAALGLFDALVDVTGRPGLFTLKWPNDVLLSGGKLAGILLETGATRQGSMALAIGFGVNLRRVPDATMLEGDALEPTSLLSASGFAVAPEDFLRLLAPAVDHWERTLCHQGFEPLRKAWLLRAARLGQTVTARLPGSRAITGRFETIDATGALVLTTETGPVILPAADVHFGPLSTNVEAVRAAGH